MKNIKKFEVINHTTGKTPIGRQFCFRGDFNVEVSLQDDGSTVKVFLSDKKQESNKKQEPWVDGYEQLHLSNMGLKDFDVPWVDSI